MSHFLIASQHTWLIEHGKQDTNGGWVCKKTGAPINAKSFFYTVYNPSLGGPQLEFPIHPQDEGAQTYEVVMLWCTKCGKEPHKEPRISVPEDLVEVI